MGDLTILKTDFSFQEMSGNFVFTKWFTCIFGKEFITSVSSIRVGPAWKKQHVAMLEKITLSSDKRQAATDNSAGLTETAVEFVKQQTPFVHKVHFLSQHQLKFSAMVQSQNGNSC